MKRFVNTANLDKTEWLRARKMGITGTDAGAIVGMNPYKSSFSVNSWLDIRGLLFPLR